MKWKIESRTRISYKKRCKYLYINIYYIIICKKLFSPSFWRWNMFSLLPFFSLSACTLSNLTFCSLRTFLLFSSDLELSFSLLCLLSFVTFFLQYFSNSFQTLFTYALYTMLSSERFTSIFIYRHYKQKIRLSFCIRPSWGAGNAKAHIMLQL